MCYECYFLLFEGIENQFTTYVCSSCVLTFVTDCIRLTLPDYKFYGKPNYNDNFQVIQSSFCFFFIFMTFNSGKNTETKAQKHQTKPERKSIFKRFYSNFKNFITSFTTLKLSVSTLFLHEMHLWINFTLFTLSVHILKIQ